MVNISQEKDILSFAQSEFKNPYLKRIKFIFADDKPNLNGQAIPYEEFAALKESAIGMPIKIRFLGRKGGAGNHDGSIPIGHIQDVTEDMLEDGTHRLLADGALYADEFPDQVEYLEEAYAANEAPGISWELSYHDSIIKDGITFLKGVIARAATFVKHPAYGNRTALLALASKAATLTDPELKKELLSLLEEIRELLGEDELETPDEDTDSMSAQADIKGGTNNVTLEEALQKIAELEAEVASTKAELEAKASETQTLEASAARIEELEATVTELEGTIAAFEKASIVAARTQKMVEAGVVLDEDAEILAQKQELWAAMSEEIFNEVVSTVKAVASKVPDRKAEASVKPAFTLPKISVDTSGNGSSENLRDRMRALSRSDEPTD